ncbi:beta-ketothiolase BktB [Roseixanthobacter glucoisosaccharinicivorans]|uniref:beta-ketothiolase BktB n=1 Tax=Roseixanthobacter glucoisosaccharinicivorans TaxID=3119923 RepID=UPI00372A2315
MSQSVMIMSGVRTAIGTFGGALASVPPTKLGSLAVAEAMKRAQVDGAEVGTVVFGHVIVTEPRDAYLSRVAAMEGGIPKEVPAMNVNRLCGSGAQAVVSAAQAILLGDCEVAVAGGAECMSRSPHLLSTSRFGQRMGDMAASDLMIGVLTDPFGHGGMGITGENVAEKWNITRAAQDELALASQQRARAAIDEGRFRDQILPVTVTVGRKEMVFDTDEHPKATTAETLAGLRAAFKKGGTVTAGNSSGINDGAASLVLMAEDRAARSGKRPLARIVGYAHAGVEPGEMGIGPVPAVRKLCERTGLKVSDFDVIESNEAFAAQACAVARELDFDPAKLNPNGGAIALGHPVGATGAILVVKALNELQRTGGRFGLITMCIGGGQGIALAIERV